MSARILFWVQYLVGAGHLARAMRICETLAQRGFIVTLANGGMPQDMIATPAGVSLEQLPPVRARDLLMTELVDQDGQGVDATWWAGRTAALSALTDRTHPDIVITETFPFGRRRFQIELLPLLTRLKARPNPPLVLASLRDILIRPEKTQNARAMCDIAQRHYEGLLVHGDPRVARLTDVFPEATTLEPRIYNTGYVTGQDRQVPKGHKQQGILVATGAGAMGTGLLRLALEAYYVGAAPDQSWTIITGPLADSQLVHDLEAARGPRLTVLRQASDLPQRMAQAALCIIRGGYNTVMEGLGVGARLLVVPYVEAKEIEQRVRAQIFSRLGLITFLGEETLTGERLRDEIGRAMKMGYTDPYAILDLSGAAQAADKVRVLWENRHAHGHI